MAPELGLFLDECVFKSYNDRWGNDREAQVSLSDFQEQVDAFKVSCMVHSPVPDLRAGRFIQSELRSAFGCSRLQGSRYSRASHEEEIQLSLSIRPDLMMLLPCDKLLRANASFTMNEAYLVRKALSTTQERWECTISREANQE